MYKKPSKPCPRKRRNMTRVLSKDGTSPRVRWTKKDTKANEKEK
jgi:hypothetical protein